LVVDLPILENMKVNGKDDIPYMKWTNKIHVWNHQPDKGLSFEQRLADLFLADWKTTLNQRNIMKFGIWQLKYKSPSPQWYCWLIPKSYENIPTISNYIYILYIYILYPSCGCLNMIKPTCLALRLQTWVRCRRSQRYQLEVVAPVTGKQTWIFPMDPMDMNWIV
jgi:hypothetical protein